MASLDSRIARWLHSGCHLGISRALSALHRQKLATRSSGVKRSNCGFDLNCPNRSAQGITSELGKPDPCLDVVAEW